jgi:Cu(I)/Ag(I) efflux system membrane fusion protein/cobalt-zinc-cadmium efflux system membrane fusion protein
MLKQITAIAISVAVGVGIGAWLMETPAEQPGMVEESTTVYRCAMHPSVVSDKPGSCPVCGMDLVADRPETSQPAGGERVIDHYRAPMDPNFVSREPGKSPMGMDLIPVYEDELSGVGGTVQIDPVTIQNIGVKTALVERRSLRRTVRTVGRVDYDETRVKDVNAKIAGWVEKLYVNYTGQEVSKGQALLEIYSPELVAAQEEYLTALDYQRRLENSAGGDVAQGARDLLGSARQRLRYLDISDEQIQRLKASGEVSRTMTLHSPQQGIVVHKAVLEGAHIAPGQHLYRIAELSTVWVYADIYEYELPWIQVGQDAEVELSYLPGRMFNGRVTYVYPFLESKTRTVRVRMSFDNADGALKPEMYANVEIAAPVAEKAVVVPVQAVIHSGERRLAVVSLGEGRFQPRELEIGVEANGFYQVLDGLREGDRIVTSSQFLIDSESNLKAAVGAMVSGSAADEDMVDDPAAADEGMVDDPSAAVGHEDHVH